MTPFGRSLRFAVRTTYSGWLEVPKLAASQADHPHCRTHRPADPQLVAISVGRTPASSEAIMAFAQTSFEQSLDPTA
jgi:hypothetical protein